MNESERRRAAVREREKGNEVRWKMRVRTQQSWCNILYNHVNLTCFLFRSPTFYYIISTVTKWVYM